jgi:hypothetical protein
LPSLYIIDLACIAIPDGNMLNVGTMGVQVAVISTATQLVSDALLQAPTFAPVVGSAS